MFLKMRPTFDQIYMDIATLLAQRAHHPNVKVGCVIVSSDYSQVYSIGYNGNYAGGPNEPESVESGKSELLHAEENALLKYSGPRNRSSIMYITHAPCKLCSKRILNSKAIGKVLYSKEYRSSEGIDLLKLMGIEINKV